MNYLLIVYWFICILFCIVCIFCWGPQLSPLTGSCFKRFRHHSVLRSLDFHTIVFHVSVTFCFLRSLMFGRALHDNVNKTTPAFSTATKHIYIYIYGNALFVFNKNLIRRDPTDFFKSELCCLDVKKYIYIYLFIYIVCSISARPHQ